MPRPKSKAELQIQAQTNFQKLLEIVDRLPEDKLEEGGVCEKWSVKDILAHLQAWHEMLLEWYEGGVQGGKPSFLPAGYTWKDTPKVNEDIYQQYKEEQFAEIFQKLKRSHERVGEIINRHSDEELFTKKHYAFTGSTSLGAYLISATSSHYDWAIGLLKKHF